MKSCLSPTRMDVVRYSNPWKTVGRPSFIIPMVAGVLVYSRLTRWRWTARYSIAIISGAGLGSITKSQIVTGVTTAGTTLISLEPNIIPAIIIFVGFITVGTYFLYSTALSNPFHSKSSPLRHLSWIGRMFLMAPFGYIYTSSLLASGTDPIAYFALRFKSVIESILTGV